MQKKGLSAVITAVIMIVLVLVAIGIVWYVYKGVIESGTDQIESETACLNIDLEITGHECDDTAGSDGGLASITVKRGTGSDIELSSIKVVVSSNTESKTITSDGNLELLSSKTITITESDENDNKVEVAAVISSNDNEKICPVSDPYEFNCPAVPSA